MKSSSYFSKPCKGATILLLCVMSFPLVTCEYRAYSCNNVTYAEGSTYSTNLNRVLNDLLRNTPRSSGFNTTSYGQTPNKVYGLLQCMGNISADQCIVCSQEANNTLHEACTNVIGSVVWMDYCFLRYDNSNFISQLDTDGIGYLENVNNITSNRLQAFRSTTSGLLSNLSNKAYDPANKGFAQGSAKYSSTDQVYGVVQCLRDLSITDCRTCLLDARQQLAQCCSEHQGAQAMLGSCTVRYETYQFFSTSESPPNGGTPPPTPSTVADSPANGRTSRKKSSKTLPIILGLVGGVILVCVICLIAMRRKVKSALFGRPERHAYSPESGLLTQEQRFIFGLEELAEATDNFDDNNKLGEGGFGAVYKGNTRDGKEIAVKKLSAKSAQGKREFMNEVKLVAHVQHRNLVKLMGCCADGDQRLLVYEYLPNKSLDTFLFDPEKCRQLDWEKRYNIIIGIARGLLYLHEDSQLRIIHRDIKSNNILLDDKLNPKIADFGLARLFPEDETHIQTRAAGTYGYMAPEYAMQGQLSVKADVYSFGVLLLEIVSGRKNTDTHLPQAMQNLLEWAWRLVSGRKNTDTHLPQAMQNLLEWAWRLYKGGDIMNMVDSIVTERCPQEQVLRCIHVGLLCVQADATARPQMSNVIMMISSSSVTLPNPAKPAFISVTKSHDSTSSEGYGKGTTSHSSATATSSSASAVPSVNDTSITELTAR